MIIFITNSKVPYCYDVANILGLPEKHSCRFRYRSRWVKVANDIEMYQNQEALIVLRNFDTAELVPIRFAKIENVLTVGDINYIEFLLKKFISPTIITNISDKISRVLTSKGIRNIPNAKLYCLVFEIDDTQWGIPNQPVQGENLQIWSNLITQIGRFNCYKDFSFLNILHLIDSNGNKAMIKKDETGKFSFLLKTNELYYLEVMQHIPWEIETTESIETPYNIELKAEIDEVKVLRKVQRVVGKYDLMRFIIKTPSGFEDKKSFLELENQQGGDLLKYDIPTLFIPIWIRPSKFVQTIRALQVVLSILAIIGFIGSESISKIFLLESDWVRGTALLLLIISSKNWNEMTKEIVKKASDVKIG